MANPEETRRRAKLTSREREILQLSAEGKSAREIASNLHISARTVDSHRANLTRKLAIHNKAGLVRYAIRHGMIEP